MPDTDKKSGIRWFGKPIEDLTRDEAINAVEILIRQNAAQHAETMRQFDNLRKMREARAAFD